MAEERLHSITSGIALHNKQKVTSTIGTNGSTVQQGSYDTVQRKGVIMWSGINSIMDVDLDALKINRVVFKNAVFAKAGSNATVTKTLTFHVIEPKTTSAVPDFEVAMTGCYGQTHDIVVNVDDSNLESVKQCLRNGQVFLYRDESSNSGGYSRNYLQFNSIDSVDIYYEFQNMPKVEFNDEDNPFTLTIGDDEVYNYSVGVNFMLTGEEIQDVADQSLTLYYTTDNSPVTTSSPCIQRILTEGMNGYFSSTSASYGPINYTFNFSVAGNLTVNMMVVYKYGAETSVLYCNHVGKLPVYPLQLSGNGSVGIGTSIDPEDEKRFQVGFDAYFKKIKNFRYGSTQITAPKPTSSAPYTEVTVLFDEPFPESCEYITYCCAGSVASNGSATAARNGNIMCSARATTYAATPSSDGILLKVLNNSGYAATLTVNWLAVAINDLI